MKLIKKDAIRFSDENDISHEELVEDLFNAEIFFTGEYAIRFLHGNTTQKYLVNKKTYAKCVQILKERIKKQAKHKEKIK
jgi:uncharacterized protein YqgQ